MHTFDVYLKKRLTEIDVIITQLVQRDAFSMYDWLYILCSIDDLKLVKNLNLDVDLNISANLENILEIVHEQIESEMVLKADIDLTENVFTNFDSDMVLWASEIDTLSLDFTGGDSSLEISVDELDYYIARSFGNVEFDMSLVLDELDTLKIGMDSFSSEMELDIESPLLSQKNVDGNDWIMYLDVPPTDLFYLLTIGGKSDMQLNVEKISDYVLKYVLHDLQPEMYLIAEAVDEFGLKKYIEVANNLLSAMEITDTLIGLISCSETKMLIDCEASAGLKRCRRLAEMDNHVLADFDNMSLNEIDYVIIAE